MLVNGKPLSATFGTEGAEWHCQDGGTVKVGREAKVVLHDLTGFEGRCDAVLFARDLNWLLGSEQFREQMLEQIEGEVREHDLGQLRLETAEAKAERIIAEELRRLSWGEADLLQRRKSDPAKLAIAARLRRDTTPSLKAIARRIHLGTSRSANNHLHAALNQAASGQPAQPTLGL